MTSNNATANPNTVAFESTLTTPPIKPGSFFCPSTLSTTIFKGSGYSRVNGRESRLRSEIRARTPAYRRDSARTRNNTGNLFTNTGNTVPRRLWPTLPEVLSWCKHGLRSLVDPASHLTDQFGAGPAAGIGTQTAKLFE